MSYSISVKRPRGFAHYQMSHNILVKQPKSYSYYNGTEAWQIDMPKALSLDYVSTSISVTRSERQTLSNLTRSKLDSRVAQPDKVQTKVPANRELIMLRLPRKFEGKTVTAGVVVQQLLKQRYGLNMRNPWVGQWLEMNAPDVKYAIAISRYSNPNTVEKLKFKVGQNGVVKVQVSPEVDSRLREVSARYMKSKSVPNFIEWFHLWVVRFFSFGRSRVSDHAR